jgi:hypothetical protein
MHEVAELLGLPSGARFWRTDLHVHTPASSDMDSRWRQATPADVVQQALVSQLEIIAVTDHNSAAWCDEIREAARGSALHVFPRSRDLDGGRPPLVPRRSARWLVLAEREEISRGIVAGIHVG